MTAYGLMFFLSIWAFVAQERLRRKPTIHLLYWSFRLFVVGGTTTVAFLSYYHIQRLRAWMSNSGLIAKPTGKNPEDDFWTFGQFVPLVLVLITPMVLIQAFSGTFG